jgi:hypothetical protein
MAAVDAVGRGRVRGGQTEVRLSSGKPKQCNTLANIHSPEQALCLNFFSAEKMLTRLIIQR